MYDISSSTRCPWRTWSRSFRDGGTCGPPLDRPRGRGDRVASVVAREQCLHEFSRKRRCSHAQQNGSPRLDDVFIRPPPKLGSRRPSTRPRRRRQAVIPSSASTTLLEGLSQVLNNIKIIQKHLTPAARSPLIPADDVRRQDGHGVAGGRRKRRQHLPGTRRRRR
ncbi:hypothetical protein QJS66_14335 [Kocuria rhizophila]|nr:hypothetical protein QJS66_14335 [Kocuria rhizophila]